MTQTQPIIKNKFYKNEMYFIKIIGIINLNDVHALLSRAQISSDISRYRI